MNYGTISLLIEAKDHASGVLTTVRNSVFRLQGAVQSASRSFQSFKTNLNTLGRYAQRALMGMTAAGTGILYFGKATEEAMANASTMFDVTAKTFEETLGGVVDDVATRYGMNLKKMWEATYMLGSSGVQLKDVPWVLELSAKAATAGATDIETAFTGAIKQIKGFGLSLRDLAKVYSVQFQAVKYGLLTYQELAMYIPSIGAAARQAGEDWVSATAEFAVLTRYMPDAAWAATALRNAFVELTKKADKFAAAGIKVYKNGKFVGMYKVLEQMYNILHGKTNKEIAEFFNNLGLDMRASSAFVNLVNNFNELRDVMHNMKADAGALNDMFQKQTSTLAFQIKRLMAALDKVKQAVYDAFKSPLIPWIMKAIVWLKGLADWINKNRERFVAFVVAVFKLLGAFVGFQLAINLLSQLGTAVQLLLNPFTLLFAVIAMWFSKLAPEKKAAVIKGIIEWVRKAVNWLIGVISNIADWLSGLDWEKIFAGIWDFLKQIMSGTWSGLKTVWNWTVTGLDKLWDILTFLGDKIWTGLKTAWEWVYESVKWLWNNILVPLGKNTWKALETAWEWTYEGAKWLWNNILVPLGKHTWKTLKTAWEWTAEEAKWLWSNILVPLGKNTWKTLETAWKWTYDEVKWLWDNILVPFGKKTKKALETTWHFIVTGELFKWVKEHLIDKSVEFFKTTWKIVVDVFEWVKKMIGWFGGAAETTWELTIKNLDWVKKFADWFNKKVKTTWEVFVDFFGLKKKEEIPQSFMLDVLQQGKTTKSNSWKDFAKKMGFAEGGYTGDGAELAVAGVVHKGEYVIPAWLVKKYPQLIRLLEGIRLRGFNKGGSPDAITALLGNGDLSKTVVQLLPDLVKDGKITVTTAREILKYVMNFVDDDTKKLLEEAGIIEKTTEKSKKEQMTWWQKILAQINNMVDKLATLQSLIPETKLYFDFEKRRAGALVKLPIDTLKLLFSPLIGSAKYLMKLPIIADNLKKASNKLEEWKNKLKDLGSKAGSWVGERAQQIVGFSGKISSTVGGTAIGKMVGSIGGEMLGALSALFGDLGAVIGPIGSTLLKMLPTLTSVQEILDPVSTIVGAMVEVLKPTIDELLQPLVGILKLIGVTLAKLLIPVLKMLTPLIQGVATILLWLYNSIIVPLGNALIELAVTVYNTMVKVWNSIADTINSLAGWLGVSVPKMKEMDAEAAKLEKIDYNELLTGEFVDAAKNAAKQGGKAVGKLVVEEAGSAGKEYSGVSSASEAGYAVTATTKGAAAGNTMYDVKISFEKSLVGDKKFVRDAIVEAMREVEKMKGKAVVLR